jgi:hypothetical protein
MIDNKQQTAVEWLFLNLKSHFEHDGDLLEVVQMSYEQAKEMEKERIAKAFDRGRFWNMSWDGNSYYEEIIIKGNNE